MSGSGCSEGKGSGQRHKACGVGCAPHHRPFPPPFPAVQAGLPSPTPTPKGEAGEQARGGGRLGPSRHRLPIHTTGRGGGTHPALVQARDGKLATSRKDGLAKVQPHPPHRDFLGGGLPFLPMCRGCIPSPLKRLRCVSITFLVRWEGLLPPLGVCGRCGSGLPPVTWAAIWHCTESPTCSFRWPSKPQLSCHLQASLPQTTPGP